MQQDLAQRLRQSFSDEERERLEGVRHPVGTRTMSVLDLLIAWALHVEKINSDLGKPLTDPKVWGAHDLVAAMFMRDFLAAAVDQLDGQDRNKVVDRIGEYDNLFTSITSLDENGLVQRVAGEDLSMRPWWWRRIPKSGPILVELLEC